MTLNPKYLKKGYTLSALDFPCTDDTARQLDQDLKAAEKEGLAYTRAFVSKSTSEFVEGERADISVITSDALDRDNEVVLPAGLNVDHFKSNPVVAFAHRYDELPVGRCEWIKHAGDNIKAKTVYASRPESFEGSFFPDSVWALVQQGMLPGKSIGFMPLEAREPSQKEIDERPEWSEAKRIITRGNLYEYSIAPVPCNPNALAEAVAKGLEIPESIAELLGINKAFKPCIVWDTPAEAPAIMLPKHCRALPDDLEARLHLLQKQLAKRKKPKANIDVIVRRLLGKL